MLEVRDKKAPSKNLLYFHTVAGGNASRVNAGIITYPGYSGSRILSLHKILLADQRVRAILSNQGLINASEYTGHKTVLFNKDIQDTFCTSCPLY